MLYNRLFDSHDSTNIRSQIGWKQAKYSIYHCGFSVFIRMDLALFVAVSLCRRLALVNKVQQCQKSERVSQSRPLQGGVRLSPQMPNTFGTGRVRFQTFLGFILHHVVWQTKSVCRIPTLIIHEAAGPASDDVAHHGGDLRYRC